MSTLNDKLIDICNNNRITVEKDILKSYLDEQIILLLDRINLLFPKIFKKSDLKQEWKNYQKWKPNIKLTEPIIISKKNKGKNTNHYKVKNSTKKKNTTNIPLQDVRCIARVFDVNKIIYQQKEATSENNLKSKKNSKNKMSSSKVINTNILKIIETDSTSFTFGRQCYGKKCGDSKYCFVHKRNNPHGDFNNIVSPHLKNHFIKMFKTFNK